MGKVGTESAGVMFNQAEGEAEKRNSRRFEVLASVNSYYGTLRNGAIARGEIINASEAGLLVSCSLDIRAIPAILPGSVQFFHIFDRHVQDLEASIIRITKNGGRSSFRLALEFRNPSQQETWNRIFRDRTRTGGGN